MVLPSRTREMELSMDDNSRLGTGLLYRLIPLLARVGFVQVLSCQSVLLVGLIGLCADTRLCAPSDGLYVLKPCVPASVVLVTVHSPCVEELRNPRVDFIAGPQNSTQMDARQTKKSLSSTALLRFGHDGRSKTAILHPWSKDPSDFDIKSTFPNRADIFRAVLFYWSLCT